MTPSTISEPIKPRSGWRMLGLMMLGMVLLTIGGGFWWYFSDSDLEAVRAQARLQGRPLSWSEMGLKLADPERLRIWKRVTELTGKLKSYQTIPLFQRKGGPIFKLWDPIPQEMRDFHQALDGATITELIELLDRLGDQTLVLHDQLTDTTSALEYNQTHELMHFMQERILLTENSDVGAWGRRMLASCRRYSADSISQNSLRTHFVSMAVKSITNRLTNLKQADPNIAADIVTTTQSSHAHLLHIIDGEFLIMLDRFSRRADFTNDSWMPLYLRAGRKDALLSLLDDRQELQFINDQTSMAWARSSETKLRVARGDMFYLSIILKPSFFLRGFFMPHWRTIDIGHKTALHGRLLAAELQGQPWPIDTFDATGAVLRPITRDGRIIAAYSVGDDGIDQGGNEKKDHIFPLYAKP